MKKSIKEKKNAKKKSKPKHKKVELYKKFRPATLDEVVGNVSTVKALQNMINNKSLPHAILFFGPSGCGKTTLARILKTELGCHDVDYTEMNCADFRGIDTSRDMRQTIRLSPFGGDCKIYLMDEFHQATIPLQNAMLKMLEDTPDHVYFFLCTTDPQKLIQTIRTRCTDMPVELLSDVLIKKLVLRTMKKVKLEVDEETVDDIIDNSGGSARKALVLLDKIKNLPSEEWSNAFSSQEEEKEGIDLCRALFAKQKSWNNITTILKKNKSEPETVRWTVMGYCTSILMRGNDRFAYHVLTCFEDHFYDSKKNGLVRACYESIHGEF